MSNPIKPNRLLVPFLALLFCFSAGAASFVVTTKNDSGAGSLRQAITSANAAAGKGIITFNISGPPPHTIIPLSGLPAMTEAVLIDGTTQPGYVGLPLVGISGVSAGSASGLVIQADGCEVRALFINQFSANGVDIENASSNVIAGCFIGTSAFGTNRLANAGAGVQISSGRNNRVGGTNAADRNLLSGNETGLWIAGNTATGNVVQGNYIGTDIKGLVSLSNVHNGVLLSAPGNTIGGTNAAARNLVSGNGQSGIYVNDAFSSNNWICGNFVGTRSNGTSALPNARDGITLFRTMRNLIGGSIPGAGNLISGNTERGVFIFSTGSSANENRIEGNLIGTDAIGSADLGNGFAGVNISLGSYNVIGGTTGLARNIISGNDLSGVSIESNSVANVVLGNFIGLDITGTTARPNFLSGVSIFRGTSNVIGGATAGAGNVLSGNGENGIRLVGGTATFVLGNLIGTDVTGKFARSNTIDGVRLECGGNFIGGSTAGARNIISGNGSGIGLSGLAASNNVIAGNFIGTDITGLARLGNFTGIAILNAPRNFIGTTDPLGGNVISGNGNSGVDVTGSGSTGNQLRGNWIGTDATGNAALPNLNPGIFISNAANNIVGGSGPGARNLISGNENVGLLITESGASGNMVLGNFLGTRPNGTTPLANRWHNIEIKNGASGNTIGGTLLGEANRAAFARETGYDGVRVQDNSAENRIRGNTFFGNNELAIDLGNGNVTLNDNNDTDRGANELQNFPVLASATGRHRTAITGSLNTRNGIYTLDFYGTDNPGGQAGRHVGSLVVTTAGFNVNFSTVLTNGLAVGAVLSATATDSTGNTSEFSPGIAVVAASDTDGDGMPDDFELIFGLNPNLGDRNLDKDADGVSNFSEYLAGTKPNDAASSFRMAMERTADRTFITAPTVPGKVYRVERAGTVLGPWAVVVGDLAGTGWSLQVNDTLFTGNTFYRVRAD